MDRKSEMVLYNGLEVNAYEMVLELNGNWKNYNRLRRRGKTSQEAFDIILRGKKRPDRSQEVITFDCQSVNAREKIEELNGKWWEYNRRRNQGEEPQQAFHFATTPRSRKNHVKVASTTYSTMKQYCVAHHLDYDALTGISTRHPEMSMEELVKFYYQHLPRVSKNQHYLFYNISLKAICLKFQLDYDVCSRFLERGVSLADTLDIAIIQNPTFPEHMRMILGKYYDELRQTPMEELEQMKEKYGWSRIVYQYAQFYKKRSISIAEALRIYQICYLFEDGWEESYQDELQSIYNRYFDVDLDKFYSAYNDLKRRALAHLREVMQISRDDLRKYYAQFYEDFVFVTNRSESFWGYDRHSYIKRALAKKENKES